jgi:acyl-CoA oxidase
MTMSTNLASPSGPASGSPSGSAFDTDRLLSDPSLVAFLPMVYVGWADGNMDDDEVETICRRLREEMGDDCGCSAVLGNWLDAKHPPTPHQLGRLMHAIKERAATLENRERLSLTELGLDLARASGGVSEVERQALETVERALGIAGSEAARQLLASRRPAAGPVRHEATFDTAAMRSLLDGAQAPLRDRLRTFLSSESMARVDPDIDRATYREQVLAWCQVLAKEGYGALGFGEAYGGQDDPAAFVAAFETIAYHDLSTLVKFGVQFGLFGGSVQRLGTKRHHDRYLRDIGTLALPGCFAMTETGHGSNVADLETVARYHPEDQTWDIHTPHEGARKEYIGNAACHGRMATVFAQLITGVDGEDVGEHRVGEHRVGEHGVHAFLVPIRDQDGQTLPGVRIEDNGHKMGLNGVDNGRLWFDHVRVPRENLLNRFATVDAAGRYESPIRSPSKRFFTMLGTLVGGRVSIGMASLSAAKSALAIAVRYANRRRQFGPAGESETALLDYPAHQMRLMPRLAHAYALHFALRDLGERYARNLKNPDESPGNQDGREVETLAAALKVASSWHATDTIQACREACGGQGYLAINRFADLKADTDVFTTFEGDNTVLLQLVAKSMLTRYKKQFHDMSLFGLMRYVASRAATNLSEKNPIVVRMTDEKHLRDVDFQRACLQGREDHLLITVAKRLRNRVASGENIQSAIDACQNHLLAAAEAFVERLVFERFSDGIAQAPETLRPVLDELRDLYALSCIEQDRGWFAAHGFLESGKSKAIRQQVEDLARDLRPQAEALVEAWGIPRELLAAPIAF